MNDIPSRPDQRNTRAIGLHHDRNPQSQKTGKSWFLGIGINNYQDFPELNNAVKDVKDIRKTLLRRYRLDPKCTETLLNEEATQRNIINYLEDLANNKIRAEDKFLLYFSGHGYFNEKTQIAYWIPQDAEEGNPASFIANSTIRDYIKAIPAFHTLLIADSCYAGKFFASIKSSNSPLDELERRRSRWGIVSGRELVEDGERGTNSPFATSILNELKSNSADKLNVALFADKVVKFTRANSDQMPEGRPLQSVGHDGGQYVFHLARSEKEYWDRCLSDPSLENYNHYLELFPNGRHADGAHKGIEEIKEKADWKETLEIDNINRYQHFLNRFPSGKYAAEARQRIQNLQRRDEEENLWTQVEEKNTREEYKKYLSRYSNGEFAAQAKKRLLELEQSERQVALEKAIDDQDQNPEIPTPPEPPWPPLIKYALYTVGGLMLAIFLIWMGKSLFGPSPAFPKKDSVELSGKGYPTIQFKPNDLIWMAQNLDYEIDGARYHSGILPDEREKYGRLYTWEEAQKACNAIGWRLPTRLEWETMAGYFGWTDSKSDTAQTARMVAGQALIDGGESGFNAQLGGSFNSDGDPADLYSDGDYWTSDDNAAHEAWNFSLSHKGIYFIPYHKDWRFSCRCVK